MRPSVPTPVELGTQENKATLPSGEETSRTSLAGWKLRAGAVRFVVRKKEDLCILIMITPLVRLEASFVSTVIKGWGTSMIMLSSSRRQLSTSRNRVAH